MPRPMDRVPAEATRLRRLQSDQNLFLDFISVGEVIELTPEGFLSVNLQEGGGLVNDAGELAISALFRSEVIGIAIGQSHRAMAFANTLNSEAKSREFFNKTGSAPQTVNAIQANADKAASMAFFYGAM